MDWRTAISKGDTERQATLRDRMTKTGRRRSPYVSRILSVLNPKMLVLDIGCGTAHIIQELAAERKSATFLGLDVSNPMLKVARENCVRLPNVAVLKGDGLILPFPAQAFDIVITRLAEYSAHEAYRVLKSGGIFFECSLGPDADKEVLEFFQDRVDKESFFFPKSLKNWKREVSEYIDSVGFTVLGMRDYREHDYYGSADELMDLIEMVPLVRDFERTRDKETVQSLAEKYGEPRGIRITWHYYILAARKP